MLNVQRTFPLTDTLLLLYVFGVVIDLVVLGFVAEFQSAFLELLEDQSQFCRRCWSNWV